jgi:hypothetical protein
MVNEKSNLYAYLQFRFTELAIIGRPEFLTAMVKVQVFWDMSIHLLSGKLLPTFQNSSWASWPVRNVGNHLSITMTWLPEHLNLRYDNYFKLRWEPYYVFNALFPKCFVPRSNWINRNDLHIETICRTSFCVFVSTSLFNRNCIAKRSSEMVTQISDCCP